MSINNTDAPPSQPMTFAEFAAYLKASGYVDDEVVHGEWNWFTADGTLAAYPEDLEW